MVQRMYTIFDRVAQEAAPIFMAPNDGVALRRVRQLMQEVPQYDRNSYKLMYLGDFDTQTMVFDTEVPKEIVLEYRDLTEEEKE